METRSKAAVTERVYVDVEPFMEWETQAAADNLSVYLPGFRKEQLKVQITSTQDLRIIGERPIGENKWSRFQKEIPIQSLYNANEITAKFEKGVLSIRHPKLAVTTETQLSVEPPMVKSPTPEQKSPQLTPQPQRGVTKPQQSPPEPLIETPNPKRQIDQSRAEPEMQRKSLERDRPQESARGLRAEGSSKDTTNGPESLKTANSNSQRTNDQEKQSVENKLKERRINGAEELINTKYNIGEVEKVKGKKEAGANGGICQYLSRSSWPKFNKATKWISLFLVVLSLVVLGLYTFGAFNYLQKYED